MKMSSRLFLVKVKDHLKATYELSIYVRFKLHKYYYSFTRQTNSINLNKLKILHRVPYKIPLNKVNTLKHGNNAEIMKTWSFAYMNVITPITSEV